MSFKNVIFLMSSVLAIGVSGEELETKEIVVDKVEIGKEDSSDSDISFDGAALSSSHIEETVSEGDDTDLSISIDITDSGFVSKTMDAFRAKIDAETLMQTLEASDLSPAEAKDLIRNILFIKLGIKEEKADEVIDQILSTLIKAAKEAKEDREAEEATKSEEAMEVVESEEVVEAEEAEEAME